MYRARTRLTQKLEGGVALRAEHYSDFGAAQSIRTSARYAFTPDFAVRGTVGTGYRAPSLGQINYTTGSGGVQPLTGVTLKNKGFPVDDPGSPGPRRTAAQAGEVGELLPGLRAARGHPATRWWWTRTRSTSRTRWPCRMTSTSPTHASRPSWPTTRDIQIARFFTNGFDVRSRGLDVVQKSRLRFDAVGAVDLSIGYSAVINRVSNVKPNTVTGSATLVNLQSIWAIERFAPRDKFIATATHTYGPLTTTLTEKRYGTYSESLSATAPTLQTFSPQYVTDLDFVYRFASGVYAGFGSKNLFNSRPDKQLYPAQQPPAADTVLESGARRFQRPLHLHQDRRGFLMTTLRVNGKSHDLKADPATPLLYVLRNELGLTGPKFGCGLAQCGACAVLLDGHEIRACVTPVSAVAGHEVTTVEGLAHLISHTACSRPSSPNKPSSAATAPAA